MSLSSSKHASFNQNSFTPPSVLYLIHATNNDDNIRENKKSCKISPGLLLLLHEAAEPRGLEAVGDAGDARVGQEVLGADGPLARAHHRRRHRRGRRRHAGLGRAALGAPVQAAARRDAGGHEGGLAAAGQGLASGRRRPGGQREAATDAQGHGVTSAVGRRGRQARGGHAAELEAARAVLGALRGRG